MPWVTAENHLGTMHPSRRADCVRLKLCQVCGEENGDHVVFVAAGLDATRFVLEGLDLRSIPARIEVKDDAVMHQRCARLAVANCPELRARRRGGRLFAFKVPIEAIVAVQRELPEVTAEGILEDKLVANTERWPEFKPMWVDASEPPG